MDYRNTAADPHIWTSPQRVRSQISLKETTHPPRSVRRKHYYCEKKNA
ncbi:MAG: hypothetical protein FWB96_11675 [Defluviitaleaceae bacterium]|nr:hypothetical protein [Defluviitaleaceae bacterium]MCL2263079.1 hypothetical protein [Defluviitaleaceae bacterium]